MEITDACVDKPRVTDYKFWEMVGASITPPGRVFHNSTPVQDQSVERNPSTKYACTCFSGSHSTNEMNAIEGSWIVTTGEELWAKAIELGASVTSGWYLQLAVDLLRSLGYISGYSTCDNVNEMRQALSINQMIYTGTNKCNWVETIKTNNFTVGAWYGHAFSIVGYDDSLRVFIAKNSYGANKYDGGYFYISYDHIDKLFTKYALVDKSNADLIINHKAIMDAEMIKKAVEAGILNGSNPNNNVTRRELMIVVGRLITLFGK